MVWYPRRLGYKFCSFFVLRLARIACSGGSGGKNAGVGDDWSKRPGYTFLPLSVFYASIHIAVDGDGGSSRGRVKYAMEGAGGVTVGLSKG